MSLSRTWLHVAAATLGAVAISAFAAGCVEAAGNCKEAASVWEEGIGEGRTRGAASVCEEGVGEGRTRG